MVADPAGVDDVLALADELKGRDLCRSGGLRDLRRARGVSVRRFARVIGANGVAPSTVSRWERGLLLPAGEHAVAVLRAAEVLATGSGR